MILAFIFLPKTVWATDIIPLNVVTEAPEFTISLQLVFLLTILGFLPSILLMMTCFTRIIISLHFLKSAMGTQQQPPNQIILGLALFVTMFVMSPIVSIFYNDAFIPYQNDEITQMEMVERTIAPLKEFMLRQTRDEDIKLFLELSGYSNIEATTQEEIQEQLPMHIVVPAFMINEIRAGFIIGFLVYLPFIVIDMVVASTLMSMGMMMLPPSVIGGLNSPLYLDSISYPGCQRCYKK
ncbi:MAG: flagellar biosynthetic protein FliP [Epulopiscium sp. Nele67-Bin005]|nr:MAG: flagellar biosynthetic protein FliP [Epulopiscium sp. Nele67-Bin005]